MLANWIQQLSVHRTAPESQDRGFDSCRNDYMVAFLRSCFRLGNMLIDKFAASSQRCRNFDGPEEGISTYDFEGEYYSCKLRLITWLG